MRILDEDGKELTPEEVDLNLGFLRREIIVIKDIPETSHIEVREFFFSDYTSYIPKSQDDPHIIYDPATGEYSYKPDPGETRTLVGKTLDLVIDTQRQYEEEEILRYIKYSEEEIEQRTLVQRVNSLEDTTEDLGTAIEDTDASLQTTNETVVQIGQDLDDTNVTVEDLVLLLAEILGGDGGEDWPVEEEKESVEEPEEGE